MSFPEESKIICDHTHEIAVDDMTASALRLANCSIDSKFKKDLKIYTNDDTIHQDQLQDFLITNVFNFKRYDSWFTIIINDQCELHINVTDDQCLVRWFFPEVGELHPTVRILTMEQLGAFLSDWPRSHLNWANYYSKLMSIREAYWSMNDYFNDPFKNRSKDDLGIKLKQAQLLLEQVQKTFMSVLSYPDKDLIDPLESYPELKQNGDILDQLDLPDIPEDDMQEQQPLQ